MEYKKVAMFPGRLMPFLALLLFVCAASLSAQQNKATFTQVTRNTYTPELYSEQVNLQILLVNLPGADVKGSTFEGSYTIYFVKEGEIEKLALSRGGRIDKLEQSDLPNKILVESGDFKKTSLASDRVFEKSGIALKSKVPDEQRTMIGKIIIFYTIKIYDAKLKKIIYYDRSFAYSPFEGNENKTARKILYLSFFVTEKGEVWPSSLPKDRADATW